MTEFDMLTQTLNDRLLELTSRVRRIDENLSQPLAADFEEQAVDLEDHEAMEAIAFYAYEASSDLAAERGTYSSYKGSKWDRGILPQDSLDLLSVDVGTAEYWVNKGITVQITQNMFDAMVSPRNSSARAWASKV